MNKIHIKVLGIPFLLSFILLIITGSDSCTAQEQKSSGNSHDTLLSVAGEYIESVRYCTLITVDSTGYPHARIMDPFKPEENIVIWLGTNRYSRKVKEITANPKVTLFYYDNKGNGYVSLEGNAYLVDDADKKKEYWKPEWERFYQNKKDYILIKFIPERLDILSYEHKIFGNVKTWRTPSVSIGQQD